MREAIPALRSRRQRDEKETIEAIATLVAAQRADLATTAALTSTLVGAGITFIVATLYYQTSLVDRLQWGAALLPLPVWVIAGFGVLTNVTMRHRMLVVGAQAESRHPFGRCGPSRTTSWKCAAPGCPRGS